MPLFTVIIPTTAHRETIRWSISAVLDQSCSDLALYVIGDGSPPRTAEIVASFRDPRVHFVEHPKSAGTGEEYRDAIIRQQPSEFVAYLEDDDMWTQDHLERMAAQLEAADFCHSLMTWVDSDGFVYFQRGDLRHPHIVARTLGEVPFNVLAPGAAAHRRDSYLRLPVGWATRPAGWWSDLWMWRKWLAQDWVRIAVEPSATYLHMPEQARRDWAPVQRMQESAHWYFRSRSPGFRGWLDRELIACLSRYAGDSVEARHALERQLQSTDGPAGARQEA
jgi:glycosyltransferase involved in cell wall biosynthesis